MAEPTLERGSKGDDVKDLQQALIELDFKPAPASWRSTASSVPGQKRL